MEGGGSGRKVAEERMVEERRWKYLIVFSISHVRKLAGGISHGSLVCIIFNREIMRKRRGGRKEVDGRRRKWKKGGGRKDVEERMWEKKGGSGRRWKYLILFGVSCGRKFAGGMSHGSLVCILFNREIMRKRRGGRKEVDGRRRKWKKGGGRKDV